MEHIFIVIACAVLIKEAAQLYTEIQRSAAIDKAAEDRWNRWHWEPTAEQAKKLEAEVAESKKLIAAYKTKQRQAMLAAASK